MEISDRREPPLRKRPSREALRSGSNRSSHEPRREDHRVHRRTRGVLRCRLRHRGRRRPRNRHRRAPGPYGELRAARRGRRHRLPGRGPPDLRGRLHPRPEDPARGGGGAERAALRRPRPGGQAGHRLPARARQGAAPDPRLTRSGHLPPSASDPGGGRHVEHPRRAAHRGGLPGLRRLHARRQERAGPHPGRRSGRLRAVQAGGAPEARADGRGRRVHGLPERHAAARRAGAAHVHRAEGRPPGHRSAALSRGVRTPRRPARRRPRLSARAPGRGTRRRFHRVGPEGVVHRDGSELRLVPAVPGLQARRCRPDGGFTVPSGTATDTAAPTTPPGGHEESTPAGHEDEGHGH